MSKGVLYKPEGLCYELFCGVGIYRSKAPQGEGIVWLYCVSLIG